MIEIGKRQTLTMVKKTDFGVYLADTMDNERTKEDEVLLPRKEVPGDLMVMDPIDVFIYRDSKDRLIATTREPLIHVGESAILKVKENGKIGAFLDWGLEKDLLLPYREQKGEVKSGDEVCVRCYVDKSGRLSASMWITEEEKKTGKYERNADRLLKILKDRMGYLSLNDKSDPEDIKIITGMSKNDFKKSVGNLLKKKLIRIEEDGIHLLK